MDHTIPSLDAGLGGEALLSLACHLKTTPVLRISRAWRTSLFGSGFFLLELPTGGIVAEKIGVGNCFSLLSFRSGGMAVNRQMNTVPGSFSWKPHRFPWVVQFSITETGALFNYH